VHTEPSDEKFPSTDLLTDTFLAMEAFTGSPLDLYIVAVVRADGPVPAISELRAMAGDKLESVSSLTLRIVETPTRRRWEPDPDFDLARHVTLLRNAPVDAAPAGSRLKSTPDRDHPLWRSAPPLAAMDTPPHDGRRLSSNSVALADLRAVGRAARATVGQVHLAAMAGAIRRWSTPDYPNKHSGAGVPV
jgi:hypothetical protein